MRGKADRDAIWLPLFNAAFGKGSLAKPLPCISYVIESPAADLSLSGGATPEPPKRLAKCPSGSTDGGALLGPAGEQPEK